MLGLTTKAWGVFACPQHFTCSPQAATHQMAWASDVLGWVAGGAVVLALCWFLIGAFNFSGSDANPEGKSQAIAMMANSAVGLILVLSGYAAAQWVLRWFGQAIAGQ